MGGQEIRIAEGIWTKMAESEARMYLMVELGEQKVGFPDVEQFCLDLERKYRATASGDLEAKGCKSTEWQVVKAAMKLKMIDEKRVYDELLRLKYKVRKKIEEECGKNSRRCRNQIKKLRKEAGSRKREVMQKNEAKMKHLRKKFQEDQEEELNKIPTVMENMKLENLTIFNNKKFDEVKTWDYEQ